MQPSRVPNNYVVLCDGISGQKLEYYMYRLYNAGIRYEFTEDNSRNQVVHVADADLDLAKSMMQEKFGESTLQDLADDHEFFKNFWSKYFVQEQTETNEEENWYDELNRGYQKDRI